LSEKNRRGPRDFSAHRLGCYMGNMIERAPGVFLALIVSSFAPATARADELLHHRFEFEGDRALPECNKALKFKALLVERVPITTFDPPTPRVLVVRVRRASNGGRAVDLLVKNESGEVLGTDHHDYGADVECFEVLYWTAIDAKKLMHSAGTPSAVTEKAPSPAPSESPKPPSPAPPAPPPAEPKPCPVCPAIPTPKPTPAPEKSRRYFLGGGAVAAYNLAPEIAIGPRILFGIERGAFVGEVDARWLPLLKTLPADLTAAETHTWAISGAACFQRKPFLACGVLTGGATWATALNTTFPNSTLDTFFGVGARGAVEAPLTPSMGLRFDLDGVWTPRPMQFDGYWFALRGAVPFYVSGGASFVLAIE